MEELTKRCPYCDEEIRANAIKCKHCGSFLSDSSGIAAMRQTSVKQALMARYEVLEELGRGGMGVVYKAIQKNLNRPVALKVLAQQIMPDEDFLKRFHSEARKAAQISHPNIITIYDEGVENGVHFIAMEYIDGEDLRNIILKNGPLAIAKMVRWLKPVIEALGFAHQRGLIHRDIKSANILISKTERPVLTDFGIARLAESSQLTRSATDTSQLTRPGMILGTLQFMSPEQITGVPASPLTDVYAIGVVMYHSLTGELPFRGDTDWSTMHKIANVAPTAPRGIRADIPKALESLVLKCMAKNPGQRYQSCEELAAALGGIEVETAQPDKKKKGTSEIKAAVQPPPRPVAEEPKREAVKPVPAKNKTMIFGLAAMAILVVIIGVLLWKNHSARQAEINALLEQAEALYRSGKLLTPAGDNAYEISRELLKRDPENEAAKRQLDRMRDDLLIQIETLRQQGNMAEAREETKALAERFPQDRLVQNRAELFDFEQRAQEAAARKNYIAPEYDNVLELCKNLEGLESGNKIAQNLLHEAERWLGAEYRRALRAGNSGRANELAEKGREYFPDNSLFEAGGSKPGHDEPRPAASSQTEIPPAGSGWLKAFNDHLERNNFDLALSELGKAKQANPDRNLDNEAAALYLRWGDELMRQDKFVAALEKYTVAAKANANVTGLKKKVLGALWLNLELAAVPGGAFDMGDTFGAGESDEQPKHHVRVSGFRMSAHEITFAQFDAFCEATSRNKPSDNGWGRGRQSAINVGYQDAVAFCRWLSQRTKKEVRLPTEAEWEYAARAGGQTVQWSGTSTGADLNEYAWSLANSERRTHMVGQKRANALGLFDMSGNAFEWCRDHYDEKYYEKSAPANPGGPEQGTRFVLRGGSALNAAFDLRCANRSSSKPNEWNFPTGFRVVSN